MIMRLEYICAFAYVCVYVSVNVCLCIPSYVSAIRLRPCYGSDSVTIFSMVNFMCLAFGEKQSDTVVHF